MERLEREQLIEAYGDGFEALQVAWISAPEASRHWKPSPAEWSAHEIVVHCADSETYASIRIRLLISEPQPVIVGYDQDQWASTFRYGDQSAELALATIAAVRASTLPVIASLEHTGWTRTGRHTDSGDYSAQDWLRLYAAHLHDHAGQIRSNVALWRLS